jgi:hypothetical protein
VFTCGVALKSEQALELAIQIADALDAAHRKELSQDFAQWPFG